jgi:cyclic pyranopterin phosphate synthase
MIDPSERKIDYLRISITDRCNERCLYCMPEGFHEWKEREEILSYEEILSVARVAVRLGFRKFRVTGGEPLVRRDVVAFIRELIGTQGVEHVGLSTNATRLPVLAPDLARAGLRSANVSLDAIDAAIYRRVTGGRVQDVIDGIDAARAAGISRIKLNAVLMRGINEDEIWPLLEFAATRQLPIRFIELMPVSLTEVLDDSNFFPVAEAKRLIAERTMLVAETAQLGFGPATYYRAPQLGIPIGFIGAMTNLHFCETCTKMRLTADGKMRPCLGNHEEVDLMNALRPSVDDDAIESAFLEALRRKPAEHSFRDQYQPRRIMTAIGG